MRVLVHIKERGQKPSKGQSQQSSEQTDMRDVVERSCDWKLQDNDNSRNNDSSWC
jgi:hypothetical protein